MYLDDSDNVFATIIYALEPSQYSQLVRRCWKVWSEFFEKKVCPFASMTAWFGMSNAQRKTLKVISRPQVLHTLPMFFGHIFY